MVVATGRLRKFEVELREKGRKPRVVATDVTLDVARSLCREMVGPCIHAVVRRRETEADSDRSPNSCLRYSIWLWNPEKMAWHRIRGRQGMLLEEALEWLKSYRDQLKDQMTMVAPAHLKSPEEMLDRIGTPLRSEETVDRQTKKLSGKDCSACHRPGPAEK